MKKQIMGAFILAAALFIHTPNAIAQEANSEYKQALQEMLNAAGSEAISNQLIPQIIEIAKTGSPNTPDSYWEAVKKKMQDKFLGKIIDGYVPIYQKYLTIDDLKQLTAFYQSPLGKKFAQASPAIMMEGTKLAQQLSMEMFKEIEEETKNYQSSQQE